ncbi:MAG: hypothetical protein HN704_11670 [Bacteroidetes bacterium]|jgi:hypothetical protein|nr:hypothetical protein [Bacteroidota bacterium]MBT6685223.1 hypothetical protein [Bacteroidota bacterium]MBT7142291.1 hypothetical protein [Bacteroidota bacterium]MBT7492251.1 hypothetical protein [Bacteroidota bacterium]
MNDSRGSIWRKWDLHIHTPYSVLNNGFDNDFDLYVQTLFKTAISKNIATIGITDYFTIDGYKKIIEEYINNSEKLNELFSSEEIYKIKQILILPNIEFRLHDLVNNRRINFHVIFSNEVPVRDIEEHFLHDLDFVHESQPFDKDNTRKLKKSNLIELGKRLKQEQTDFSGEDLFVGMSKATVQHKDISDKLKDSRFKEKHIIGVPPDEDLSDIDWSSQEHMIRKLIIQKSNFLFASNPKTIQWALGKYETEEQYIKEFKSLKPCLWGSDAHEFGKLFEPDLERYCWIKADTTFNGLRQILYEPEERVYIGKRPKFIDTVNNNPTKYFNKVLIKPLSVYNGRNGKWFDNLTIEFNNGLCGIIGNKGKGKSAVADILGLLGNSKVSTKDQKDKLFSFLNKSKFCKRGFAENFEAIIFWNDGTNKSSNLSDNIDYTDNEKIKYIPQKFFEDLCSTEDDENFREELNNVVFSRVANKDKLGKNTFNELIDYKTELFKNEIDGLIIKLRELNTEIIELNNKKKPEYKSSIENKIKGKRKELDAHDKIKEEITVVKNPSDDEKLSEEQRGKSDIISKLIEQIYNLQKEIEELSDKQDLHEIEKHELERLYDDTKELEDYIDQWKANKNELFKKYGLSIGNIIKTTFNKELISAKKGKQIAELKKIENFLSKESVLDEDSKDVSLVVKDEKLKKEKLTIEGELEKPFKEFHDYQQKVKEWGIKKKEIEGDDFTPNTLIHYKNELLYIENKLNTEYEEKREERSAVAISIYRKKKDIQDIYNSIKLSITELLSKYSNDQRITLETSFEVDNEYYKSFFGNYINRYGAFYQKDNNYLRDISIKYDFDNEDNVIQFINGIIDMDVHYKENKELLFLNYIFSLDYLNPRYNLRLNNKGLKELSPGERGGLLLIFYLILDKDDKPLVIDQPEDNLDNQSVSEILVPYIREAKKRRQIIMVTHNPNLAVVSDADQIIRMNIDKENNFLVSQISGAIENPEINKSVVDILEGKMKAFNNRRLKYYNK